MIEGSDGLAGLRAAFERQLALCNTLEQIADSLPTRLDREACLATSRLIGPVLSEAHRAEEAVFFPRIVATHVLGTEVVDRLRGEHLEDLCFGEEVRFELEQLGTRQPILAPEATGYMLRGFFECLRRHVQQEIELLAALSATLPANS